ETGSSWRPIPNRIARRRFPPKAPQRRQGPDVSTSSSAFGFRPCQFLEYILHARHFPVYFQQGPFALAREAEDIRAYIVGAVGGQLPLVLPQGLDVQEVGQAFQVFFRNGP